MGRTGPESSVGRHGTAWNGMDACTRCGEAIPVVWARNTDDPSGQTHTYTPKHTHTHPHPHTSPPTSHKQAQAQPKADQDHQTSPERRGDQARRQTLLHLGRLTTVQ